MLEPYKALDHAATVNFGNAGAAVSNRKRDALAIGAGPDYDFRLRAVDLARFGSGILDRVVDEIGQRLADQFAIADDFCRAMRLDLQRQAILVSQRLVHLADVARDLGGVELDHVIARLPGLGARDHQ